MTVHLDLAGGQEPGQPETVGAGALDTALRYLTVSSEPLLETPISGCSRWERLAAEGLANVVDGCRGAEVLVGVRNAVDGVLWFDHG